MTWALLFLVGAVLLSARGATSPGEAPSYDWHGFTLAELSRTSSGVPNVPPADVLASLEETALRLRLTLDAWPGARFTSVYRSHDVTSAIWSSQNPQPTWDWHERGHAADIVVPNPAAVLQWSQDSGLWTGADSQNEGNHLHLAWS